MRRQRSIFDIFPENVDLNQGPNYNSSGLNDSDECNNRMSPPERRLLSNDLSGEINFSFMNAGHHHSSRSFRSWDVGESSSRSNSRDQVANDGLKLDNNHLNSQFHDSRVAVGPSNMRSSESSRMPMDVDLNVGYGINGGNPEMEASSSGTSDECEAEFSFGNWGQSGKRKLLEGTSGGIFGSGSSTYFPEAENIAWHAPNPNNGSSSLSASSPSVNSQTPMNTIPGVTENSRRSYGVRDSSPSTGNLGSYSNSNSSHQAARQPFHGEYLDQTSRGPILTSANSSPLSLQLPVGHVPGMPSNTLPFPWSGPSGSTMPRESGSGSNLQSTIRNNEQHRYFVQSNEMSNSVQDPDDWSLGMSSGSHPSNAVWMPPRVNPTTQSQQSFPEFSPWTLLLPSEADSLGGRGPFPRFLPGSSSTSEENTLSSGGSSHGRAHQPFPRSASIMEAPGDEWQAFAAGIEGRHRLVAEMRQILSALRRGENLRAEDFMLFDPFISGVADLHDRHRDMRLDVDNMSYEELLALEERIGDVKTGLSEEVILKSMKQRKHISFMAIPTQNSEPCCICREEYENGDDIGSLDCGHDFHTCCIKQWLAQKNLCPICKMTGLST